MRKTKDLLLLTILLSFFSFQIKAQSNECATAQLLANSGDWCSAPGAFNNLTATTSTQKIPGCWTDRNNDVWFKFVAVEENITVSVTGDGANPLQMPQIAMYFNDCSILPETDGCSVAAAGQNNTTSYKGGMNVGQEYLIRVHGANSGRGTFSMCLKSFKSLPEPGQDCADATYLCSKDPVTNSALTGWGNNSTELQGTCLYHPQIQVEKNVTWYYWECGKAGSLTFDITPLNDADLDFVLFELPNGIQNACQGKIELRCIASGDAPGVQSPCKGPTGLNLTDTDITENFNCDPGENHYGKFIDMQLGKKYALIINNFNNQGGFLLEFGGTGEFLAPTASYTAVPQGCNQVVFEGDFKNADDYTWNFGAGANPPSANTPGPHTVTYSSGGSKDITLTVTHSSCEEIENKSITVGGSVSASINASVDQCGNTVTISSPTPADSYNWNFGTGATPPTANGAGPHTVTYSGTGSKTINLDVNSGGCNGTQSSNIMIQPGMVATITSSGNDGCDRQGGVNGVAEVGVTGGTPPYTYQWDDVNQQTTAEATGLPVGIYNVTVKDDNNCETSASTSIEEIIQVSILVNAHPCPTCNDGSVTATIGGTGTPPYTVRWDDVNQQTTETATGLPMGAYTITVTDDKGCRGQETVSIGAFSINDTYANISKLNIFPSPAQSYIQVEYELEDNAQIEYSILNLLGEKVVNLSKGKRAEGHYTDIIELPAHVAKGMYILNLDISDQTISKRILIK